MLRRLGRAFIVLTLGVILLIVGVPIGVIGLAVGLTGSILSAIGRALVYPLSAGSSALNKMAQPLRD